MGYKVIRSDNYLKHFGVLGMHWGEWNEETRARYMGGSKRSGQVGEDGKPKKRGLTERQKKAIKIGATIAATILVSYAGVKLSTDPRFQSMVRKGLEKANKTQSIEDMIANNGPVVVRKSDGAVVKDLDFGLQYYDGSDGYIGRKAWGPDTEVIGNFSDKQLERIKQISENIKNIDKDAYATASQLPQAGNCNINSVMGVLPESYQGQYSIKDGVSAPESNILYRKIFNKELIQVGPGNSIDDAVDNLQFELELCNEGTKGAIRYEPLVRDAYKVNELKKVFNTSNVPGHIINWEKIDGEIVYYDSTRNTIFDSSIAKQIFEGANYKSLRYVAIDSNSKIDQEALDMFFKVFCNKE